MEFDRADMEFDRADMESAPTVVNMVWHNNKFMQLNIVDGLIVFSIAAHTPSRVAGKALLGMDYLPDYTCFEKFMLLMLIKKSLGR